jgi:hypothetical protein
MTLEITLTDHDIALILDMQGCPACEVMRMRIEDVQREQVLQESFNEALHGPPTVDLSLLDRVEAKGWIMVRKGT